ncbi:winged helix-turn-helix domain-containing protein [Eshraghiella crossota]|uniref:winged helix-turn-helix domain-containing protein n=1 Tax=Eshraghiella crossota TaxID=45851 RepID=UPI003AB68DFE
MKNKGRVLDRDTILTGIWGFDYDGDTRVVDTHIKRIKEHCDKGKCRIYVRGKIKPYSVEMNLEE